MTMLQSYNTDLFMKKIWTRLLSDFRVTLNAPDLFRRQSDSFEIGAAKFREEKWPNKFSMPPYYFKRQYQLENLFKRYVFTDDAFTPDELVDLTRKKFLSFQESIATPIQISEISFRVCQEARKICRQVLGKYSLERHEELCRFGKRSAVSVPYTDSYLDVKVERLNGSLPHIKWFYKYLEGDHILERITRNIWRKSQRPPSVEALSLACVPKSWKADRGIMPNSVIGSFYSYGLGRYVQERLADSGLNIKTLQKKHGLYAKESSVSRFLVTGDLSSASDGPTSALINRIVPRDWFNAFKLGRVSNVLIGDGKSQLMSFMAMGIGFTFTLETLLFYSLLKAIARLSKTNGLISVYGDDLVYPRKMHKYVAVIFPQLRILMNEDKTFVDTHFRESCGSDFYHGYDVRPFQPEMVGGELDKAGYLSFLYKMYNGFTKRWDPVEIPGVLQAIIAEISAIDCKIYQVPPSFPDDSGVHVDRPNWRLPWFEPWIKVSSNPDQQSTSFLYRKQIHSVRPVLNKDIYYWERLRAIFVKDDPEVVEKYESLADRPMLLYRKIWSHRLKEREAVAVTLDKTKHSMLEQTSSTSNWAWVRQD